MGPAGVSYRRQHQLQVTTIKPRHDRTQILERNVPDQGGDQGKDPSLSAGKAPE